MDDAFQNMTPFETVFFVLLVYSPYYLPIILVLWLILIAALAAMQRRKAAKRAGIVLLISIGLFIVFNFATKTFV